MEERNTETNNEELINLISQNKSEKIKKKTKQKGVFERAQSFGFSETPLEVAVG